MRKFLILIIFLFTILPQLMAQEKVEMEIGTGDTAVIGKSTGAEVFAYLDIFRKTRWDPDPLPLDSFSIKFPTYDSSTGNGFYRYFFRGDFDAAELPNAFEGRGLEILGIEVLVDTKTGDPKNIMYLKSEITDTVIWVDFDDAMKYGEIETFVLNNNKNIGR